MSRARSSFRGIQAFRGRRKIALAPSPARRCETYNVEVVRCDNFVTPNSLKSHAGRKLLSPLVQYPCRNAQVVHAFGLKSSRPEITHSAQVSPHHRRHLSRGFPWRFADAGPGVRGAVIVGRHPKTFTFPDLGTRNRDVRFTPMTGHRQLNRLRPKTCTGTDLCTAATRRFIRSPRRRAANNPAELWLGGIVWTGKRCFSRA